MRVEIDTATEQDDAEAANEAPDPASPEGEASATPALEKSRNACEDENTNATEDIAGSDVAASEDAAGDDAETEAATIVKSTRLWRRIKWSRITVFWVLPVLALLLAAAAGFLKWQDSWVRDSGIVAAQSVSAAKESTVALLSYQPDSVKKDLSAARDRLTGKFKESYTQLVHDVVIPGAKKQHIAAVATVPAAASVSATPDHAVVLVFVSQTVTVGNDAPTDTASTVRVTLDNIGGHWLISAFDPV